jgi:hypothetical protein
MVANPPTVSEDFISGGQRARALGRYADAHKFFADALRRAVEAADIRAEIAATEELAFNAMDYWPAGEGDAWCKARELCETALQRYKLIGDQCGVARMLRLLAHIDVGRETDLLCESLDICTNLGDRHGMIETWMVIGKRSHSADEQTRYLEMAASAARELGDDDLIARASELLGILCKDESALEEAIAAQRRLGKRVALVRLLLSAAVLHYKHEPAKRASLRKEALAVAGELGSYDLAKLCDEQLRSAGSN